MKLSPVVSSTISRCTEKTDVHLCAPVKSTSLTLKGVGSTIRALGKGVNLVPPVSLVHITHFLMSFLTYTWIAGIHTVWLLYYSDLHGEVCHGLHR